MAFERSIKAVIAGVVSPDKVVCLTCHKQVDDSCDKCPHCGSNLKGVNLVDLELEHA